MKTHSRLGGLLTAVLMSGATALPAAALTLDETSKLTGPDRQKTLEAGAKKEGQVTFYSTAFADRVLRPMAVDFNKRYPFLELKYVRAGSSSLLQRVTSERRANSVRVDVLDADLAAALKKAGVAHTFTSPVLAEYPKDSIDPDGAWVANRFSWQGIAWNTKLVKASQAPKTWESLLDPKWKGKMAWGSSTGTGGPRVITHWRKLWGEKKTLTFLTNLKKQNIRIVPGSVRSVLDQVIGGEYAVGVSMAMHHIAISKAKGAPIEGTSPEPSLARSQTLMLVKGAPHPHAAMLFIDYFLGKDAGQLILRKAKYNPAHPAVDALPDFNWYVPAKIGRKQLAMTPKEIEGYRKKSQSLFKSMFK